MCLSWARLSLCQCGRKTKRAITPAVGAGISSASGQVEGKEGSGGVSDVKHRLTKEQWARFKEITTKMQAAEDAHEYFAVRDLLEIEICRLMDTAAEAALEAYDPWINVNDRLPADCEEPCLVWTPYEVVGGEFNDAYYVDGQWRDCNSNAVIEGVTHWQLPSEPKNKERK